MHIYNNRDTFYQWDVNQKITDKSFKIGEKYHIDNTNYPKAFVVKAYDYNGSIVIDVPNVLLQQSFPIIVYKWVETDDSCYTCEKYTFGVKQRPKPSDYIYTQTEVLSYESLNERVTKLENSGGSATVDLDTTLSEAGKAADSKATGDALRSLSDEIVTTSESKVSAHNTGTDTHSDIRLLIKGLTDRLNALADSDDTTLDQLSEVVAYIKSNRGLIDAITTSKVSVSDIVDNLTTNASNKPLSAAQGVALKALIDAISIPDKLPNPNALTFTGAVTGSYDGSVPLSVEIPSGGGGGEIWGKLVDESLAETVESVTYTFDNCKRIIALISPSISDGESVSGWKKFTINNVSYPAFNIAIQPYHGICFSIDIEYPPYIQANVTVNKKLDSNGINGGVYTASLQSIAPNGITEFGCKTAALLKAGTKIEIWGVKS